MIVDEPSAVIGGWQCTALGVALRDYQRRYGFSRLPPADRALVDRAIAEIEEAGRRWRAGVEPSGQERPGQSSFVGAPHELLTVDEVAETLGVSVSTVRRMAGDGMSGLPVVRVGSRSIRYRRTDVEDLVGGC